MRAAVVVTTVGVHEPAVALDGEWAAAWEDAFARLPLVSWVWYVWPWGVRAWRPRAAAVDWWPRSKERAFAWHMYSQGPPILLMTSVQMAWTWHVICVAYDNPPQPMWHSNAWEWCTAHMDRLNVRALLTNARPSAVRA
eukprot:gene6820-12582_t